MTSDSQRDAWSRVAKRRQEIMIGYLRPMWTSLLDGTTAARGDRLLDAGCGSGELPELALERGCTVVGLDIAPTMIELCRANPRLAEATFIEGSTDDLPFEQASFDVVTSAMSVHFCNDVPRALGELYRVLRPGGRVGIAAPASTSLEVLIVFEVAKQMLPAELHYEIVRPTMFAPDGVLAGSLTAAGFADISERVADTPLAGTSFSEIWEAQKVWAPVQAAVDIVGEPEFLEVYQSRLRERVGTATPSRLEMAFRIVTGVKPKAV